MPFDSEIRSTTAAAAQADVSSMRRFALYMATMPASRAAPISEANALAQPSFVRRLRLLYQAWRQRVRMRRTVSALGHLDARLLADIGLAKGEPAYMALKANWYVEPPLGRVAADLDQTWHRL